MGLFFVLKNLVLHVRDFFSGVFTYDLLEVGQFLFKSEVKEVLVLNDSWIALWKNLKYEVTRLPPIVYVLYMVNVQVTVFREIKLSW